MRHAIIECGTGKIGVYEGYSEDEDETPCLVFTTDGTGEIGKPTGRELPAVIPDDIKLATVFFTKEESVDAVIKALERIKSRFKPKEKDLTINAKKQCEYFTYQTDCNDEIVIVHCTHPDNTCDREGNCTTNLCPLTKEI